MNSLQHRRFGHNRNEKEYGEVGIGIHSGAEETEETKTILVQKRLLDILFITVQSTCHIDVGAHRPLFLGASTLNVTSSKIICV